MSATLLPESNNNKVLKVALCVESSFRRIKFLVLMLATVLLNAA